MEVVQSDPSIWLFDQSEVKESKSKKKPKNNVKAQTLIWIVKREWNGCILNESP